MTTVRTVGKPDGAIARSLIERRRIWSDGGILATPRRICTASRRRSELGRVALLLGPRDVVLCRTPPFAILLGLCGIGLDEAAVAVGLQYEAAGLPLHAADDHQGLAEVALGVARRMGQRHEHLPRLPAVLPHVVLDDGVLAIKPVLVAKALEDVLGRVALLLGTREVVLQDPVEHR